MRVKYSKSNKGFTLVELIVVIVILAILAALLVPALLGYIDRAKNQQYITEAKELMTATQAGIAEAYATRPKSFSEAKGAVRKPNAKGVTKENYGYFTSNWLKSAKDNDLALDKDVAGDSGSSAKKVICNRVVQYADTVNYQFADNVTNGVDISVFNKNAGFVVLFNKRGKIIYMQYARDGHLVTFDGSSFKVETGKNLKFISFTNGS